MENLQPVQMEMRGAASPDARVLPIGHNFGIDHHLIEEPDERDVGEFVIEMVANRPGELLPLFRFDSLRACLKSGLRGKIGPLEPVCNQ
jgi:hypothetical protein